MSSSKYDWPEKEIRQREPIWRRAYKIAPKHGLAIHLSDSKPFELLTMLRCGFEIDRIMAVDKNRAKLANLRQSRLLPEWARWRYKHKTGDIEDVAYKLVIDGQNAAAIHLDFMTSACFVARTITAVLSSGLMQSGAFAVSVLNGRESKGSFTDAVQAQSPLLTAKEKARVYTITDALMRGAGPLPVKLLWHNKYTTKTGQSMLCTLFGINLGG